MSTHGRAQDARIWAGYRHTAWTHGILGVYGLGLALSILASHTWPELLAFPIVGTALCFLARPLRAAWKSVAVLGLGVPASLGVMETTFRLRYFGVAGIVDVASYSPVSNFHVPGLIQRSPDDELGFELSPVTRAWVKGAPIRVNRDGFRDDEPVGERAHDGKRIAIVGDSVTFGSGVREEEVFAKRLQDLLASESGAPYEVLNCGLPGAGLLQLVRLTEEISDRYAPDLILFAVTSGLVDDRLRPEDVDWDDVLEKNRSLGERMSAIRRYSFVANLVSARNKIGRIAEGTLAVLGTAPISEPGTSGEPVLADAAHRLAAVSSASEVAIVGTVIGTMDFSDASWDRTEAAVASLHHAFEEAGLPAIDTFTVSGFRKGESAADYVIYPGDAHPNAAAHSRVAGAILRSLEDGELLPKRTPATQASSGKREDGLPG